MSKRKRTLHPFVQMPVYLAVRTFMGAVLTGSVEGTMRAARGVGRTYAKFEPKRLARTIDSLGVAFPDMPRDEREARAIEAYEHLFALGVEMAWSPRLLTPDGWSQHVRIGDLRQAMPHLLSGRGCVLITGHCGNWELLGYTLALMGFKINAIYRPLDLAPLDRWVRGTRESRGLVLLDKFEAARRLPRLLSSGGLAGFIADQNAGDRGMFVPFFNRLASTYKTIGLMALRYDAPVICGQARRLVSHRDATSDQGGRFEQAAGFERYGGEPFRYQIDVVDVITPEEWKVQPDPLFYITARYRRALETMVRRAPEQNLWLHRYWKSRPRHEHLGRSLPASLREKIAQLPWTTDEDLARIEEWTERDARVLAEKDGGSGAVVAAA